MTFGVIGKEEPLLAELLMLAFQAAGHECLIFEDVDEATCVLHSIQVDAFVVDIHVRGRDCLDWLETMAAIRPDFPSRTLLLAQAALPPETAARTEKLGAEVLRRPLTIGEVERLVTGRLEKAQSTRASLASWGRKDASPSGFVN
jgi:DNA-binding response OmpR family regulator